MKKIILIIALGVSLGGCSFTEWVAASSLGALAVNAPQIITTANTDTQIANNAVPEICAAVDASYAAFLKIAAAFNVGQNLQTKAQNGKARAELICNTLRRDNPQNVVQAGKALLDAYNAVKQANTQAQLVAVAK